MKQSVKSRLKRAAIYLLGFSITPMFSACYGVPTNYDDIYDFDPFDDISGTVMDRKTEKPIPGIKVRVASSEDISAITDANGKFHINHTFNHNVVIFAEDIDGNANGSYWRHRADVTNENNTNLNIFLLPEEK